MLEEKRRFTRIPFRVKAEMQVEDVLYPVEMVDNLSVGGCLLPIRGGVKPGAPCDVRILLTGTNTDLSVKIRGEIIRSDSECVAVRFTHIDPDSLFHLRSIIRYNASDPEAVEQEIAEHPAPF